MRVPVRLCVALSLVSLLIACKGNPNTPEFWEKAYKEGRRAQERARVMDDLNASGKATAAFAPTLHRLLATEKKEEVKAAIAHVLGDIGDPSSVQPLADAIDLGSGGSDTNKMNRAIAVALGQIKDPAAVAPLIRLLKAKDGFVQLEAMRALGAHRAKQAVEPLITFANDEGAEALINRRAVQSLGEIGDPKAIPTLVKLMYKQHRRGDTFYGDSSFALYQIGGPAKDAVLKVLRGEDKDLFAWARENGVDAAALYAKAGQVLGDLQDRRAEPLIIQRLGYKAEDPGMTLLMQMTLADALGRLRSQSAVKPLAGLLHYEEVPARQRFVWALVRIGGRDAMPQLQAAASKGPFDAREIALSGVTLLGDERELPLIDKLRREERGLTATECEEYGGPGCNDVAALAQKRLGIIDMHAARLAAAQECKGDAACWLKKLEAKEPKVRERAALELGRTGSAQHAEALATKLVDPDLDARVAAIQALDWITEAQPDSAKTLGKHLPEVEKQLAQEKSSLDYARVNEDLKRLAVKLRRAQAT